MEDDRDERSKTASLPLSQAGSATAPFIFVDGAGTFGFNDGVANITLEAITHVSGDDSVITERRVVAHLRMGVKGLASLKKAIEAIELMAHSPRGSMN